MKKVTICTLIGMAAMLCASATAYAGSTTYSYTGNAFDVIVGSPGVDTSNFLSMQLTYSDLLPFGLTTTTPDSWSITDGIHTLTSSSSGIGFEEFRIGSDGSGGIYGWQVQVNGPAFYLASTAGCNSYGYQRFCDTVNLYISETYGLNDIAAGSWTESSATPEPGSLLLITTGFGGFVLGRRRRA